MNQETIANLQTLMIELEMIETKNQEVTIATQNRFVLFLLLIYYS